MTRKISLYSWLVTQNLTPQQADLWSDFIGDAFELIDEGYALHCSAQEWSSFISGCHADHATEPEITSGLGDRMRRLQEIAPIDSSRDRLTVGYEVATPGDHSHGIRKSKADFRFDRKFEAGYLASFVLEAKPLRTPADMNSRYLGDEGIGCFLERDPPYSTDIIVGMIGYAFRNHLNWHELLGNRLAAFAESCDLFPIALPSGKVCSISTHERTTLGLSNVTVCHTILDYSSNSI